MQSTIQRVGIGLGSNLGDREELLNQVFQAARNNTQFSHIAVSHLYETKPVDGDGGDYLNAALVFHTRWSAADVYRWMMTLEQNAGRARTVRNAPRTLDLDLLFYGNEAIQSPQLTVPHPRLHERAFVLVPLAEVAPDWIHPRYKKSALEMRNALDLTALLEIKKYENHTQRETVSKDA